MLPVYLTLDKGGRDTTHLSCYVLKDNSCCKIKHSTVCIINLVLPWMPEETLEIDPIGSCRASNTICLGTHFALWQNSV